MLHAAISYFCFGVFLLLLFVRSFKRCFFSIYIYSCLRLSPSPMLVASERSLRNLMADTSSNVVCTRFKLRFAYLLFPDSLYLSLALFFALSIEARAQCLRL